MLTRRGHMTENNSYIYQKNKKRNLIVSFASNGIKITKPVKFEFVKSLTSFKLESDFLFIRDQRRRWYLDGLGGIGDTFDDTLSFLRNIIEKYDKVIFIGVSAGGYASILFGSLLSISNVIAFVPQTDLDYVQTYSKTSRRPHLKILLNEELNKTIARRKYGNLKNYINAETEYYLYTDSKLRCPLHKSHHYNNIAPSIKKLHSIGDNPPEFIKSGKLENLLISLLFNKM